jgi:hypothetical protein
MLCLLLILYLVLTVSAQFLFHFPDNAKELRLRYPGTGWIDPGMTLDIRGATTT